MKRSLFLLATLIVPWISTAGTVSQDITLFKGSPDDPYTVYYPLEIKEPGKIDIRVKIKSSRPAIDPHDSPVSIVLVDVRAFNKERISTPEWQKWVQKANRYNPAEYLAGDEIRTWVGSMKSLVKGLLGKKKKPKIPDYVHEHGKYADRGTYFMSHAVDMPEFGKHEGRYILVLNNTSRSEIEQTLIITTTDSIKDEPDDRSTQAERPDLQLKRAVRNRSGQLTVFVDNAGKGGVPQRAYEITGERAPTLRIDKNRGDAVIIPLSEFDPERKLMTPGSSVSVAVPSLEDISEGDNVRIFIDPERTIRESDEQNNRLDMSF